MMEKSEVTRRHSVDRRTFLEQYGRLAIVTPPVVTLLLSLSDKAEAAQLVTSGQSASVSG